MLTQVQETRLQQLAKSIGLNPENSKEPRTKGTQASFSLLSLGDVPVHPKPWNIEADPAGEANTKMAATIMKRKAR